MAAAAQIYLASTSPRRKALLGEMRVSFETLFVDIDETPKDQEVPQAYVERLALEKAIAGWHLPERQSDLPVLGSDTTVVIDDCILGKPSDYDHALSMLQQLSGKTHQVLTAVALVQGDRRLVETVTTGVTFKSLDYKTMESYCSLDEPYDKAGAYGIQGEASKFVESISGSYSSIVGLPIEKVSDMLKQFNITIFEGDQNE